MCTGSSAVVRSVIAGRRRVRVEVQRDRVDVGEHRPGALVQDRVGRRHERERRRDDLVAVLHADRAQREVQRRGAGRDRARVRRPDPRGERLLELGTRGPSESWPERSTSMTACSSARPSTGAGERDHALSRPATGSMPASSESTSASQLASITFSCTPIAPHVSVPSEASSSTRVVAPVAFHSSRMRTL